MSEQRMRMVALISLALLGAATRDAKREVTELRGQAGVKGMRGGIGATGPAMTFSSDFTVAGTVGLATGLSVEQLNATVGASFPVTLRQTGAFVAGSPSAGPRYCTLSAGLCNADPLKHYAYMPCNSGEVAISGGCWTGYGAAGNWRMTMNCPGNADGCVDDGETPTGWVCRGAFLEGGIEKETSLRPYVYCLKQE